LGSTSLTESDGFSTYLPSTGWAKATLTQDATNPVGTLVLTQYTDGACANAVANSAITLKLPVASTAAPFGPFGTLSPCAASFTAASGVKAVNNRGGTYTFSNKLEMESALGFLSTITTGTPNPQGPVYATFADNYCTMANSVDGAGNIVRLLTPLWKHYFALLDARKTDHPFSTVLP